MICKELPLFIEVFLTAEIFEFFLAPTREAKP